MYTPKYAVIPLLKYLKPSTRIWCPFDKKSSEFVNILTEGGHRVLHSHIDNGEDFFCYLPEEDFDIIISNPPFSKKDAVLKRLDELKKPFAMLLPIQALQGKSRFPYLKDIQYLGFDKRINFFKDPSTKKCNNKAPFPSCYLCKSFLPRDLIIEELDTSEI